MMSKVAFLCLLLFVLVWPASAETKSAPLPDPIDDKIEINNSFFQKTHTLEELKQVLDQFDTYDYVRTKNQREELVRYLLKEFTRFNDNYGIAKCENIMGVLLRDRAEYASAIGFHESALMHAKGDTTITIFSLNNLGVVYRRLDKPRIALDYHMEALNLAESYSGEPVVTKRSACVALNSIGNIHLVLEQPEEALQVFRRTLRMEKELDNHLGIAINFQNMGYCYEAMGDLTKAMNLYEESLHENEKINSNVGRSICYNSIGELHLKQDKAYDALETFQKAMIFAEMTNDNYYISQTHANIGKSYLALNSPDRAFKEFEIYHQLSKEIQSKYLIMNSLELLSEYNERIGNYAEALSLFKQAVAINDSITSDKNTRYLNEIQTIYDSDKQRQQIELLTVENQIKSQQNLFYLFGVVVLILIFLVVYAVSRRRNDKRHSELEARLFRSQMNPHFLFNALGSIQSFLYQNEAQKAAAYLGNFSKLTRSILQNSTKELITLEEEINALKNYIEIEQMRQNYSFNYSVLYNEEVELDFIYVLPTMIQPFVENAILHGFKDKNDENPLLQILLDQHNNFIRIQIIDNGKGIKSALTDAKNPHHKSMGMNIFKERIRNIERKYKKSVKFDVQDRKEKNPNESGTIVTIDFPLIEPHD